jgi:hypothetical protein
MRTPGEWKAYKSGVLSGHIWVVQNSVIPVPNKDDRNLIAAAPNLLDACKAALEALELEGIAGDQPGDTGQMLRDAIAKAEPQEEK